MTTSDETLGKRVSQKVDLYEMDRIESNEVLVWLLCSPGSSTCMPDEEDDTAP